MILFRLLIRVVREISCFTLFITLQFLLYPVLLFRFSSDAGKKAVFLLAVTFPWGCDLLIRLLLFLPNAPHTTGEACFIWPMIICLFFALGMRRSVFFQPIGLKTFLPEADWIGVGTRLIGLFDLRMSRSHRRRLVRETDLILTSLPSSAFAAIEPHGLVEAYRGLAGRQTKKKEYDIVPPAWNGSTVIVFLHGHGGNLILYPLVWQDFALRNGVRIVMPSFSHGNWESPKAVETIRELVERIRHPEAMAKPRIFLAGISQGGAGVSRAAAAMPDALAGLIYFSPTMELGVIQSQPFEDGWKGKPALVFQGGQDRNVHPRTVTPAVESMRHAGIVVTYILDENEDHFFFFGQRERVQDEVARWMGSGANSAAHSA